MENIRKKVQNEELLYANDLQDLFVSIIKSENLTHIVDKILISGSDLSGFSADDKLITINLNELWYKTKYKENFRTGHDMHIITSDEFRKNTCANPNKVNIYNINAFFHEVRHAYQYDTFLRLLKEDSINTLYDALLYKDLIAKSFIQSLSQPYSNIVFDKYHNYFFDEYDANINSYINVIDLFNNFNLPNLKEVLELYNKLIATNLYMLYKDIKNIKVNSIPVLNMIKLYNAFHTIIGDKFDDDDFLSFDKIENIDMPNNEIDRLKLGLRLDYKTLNYFYKVAKGKEKTLNLFDNIKNL